MGAATVPEKGSSEGKPVCKAAWQLLRKADKCSGLGMRGVCEENHAGTRRASTCHRDCGAPEKSRSIRCAPSHGSVAQLRMTKERSRQMKMKERGIYGKQRENWQLTT